MTTQPVFRCFILDLDGTAVDTAPDIARSANRTLVGLGLAPLPDDVVASYIGGGVPVLMQRCLGDLADQYMERAVPMFMELYSAEPAVDSAVYPGVLEAVETIKAHGGVVAVCTQKPEAITHKILVELGLEPYVDFAIGPESVTHRKPHPEPVLKVLAALGVAAPEALFVGDTASDMVAAKAAEVATVAVTYGYGSEDSLRAENPDYVVDSFSQVLQLVAIG